MPAIIATDAANETFKDLQDMLYHLVNRIYRHDPDEGFSLAQLAYCQAKKDYDPTKGASFSSWVYLAVWGALTEARRTLIRRNTLARPQRLTDTYGRNHTAFKWVETAVDLTEEAKIVVRLICQDEVLTETLRTARTQKGMRDRIACFLRSMGWTAATITATFEEITEAICS